MHGTQIDLPKIFSIQYKRSGLGKFINFSVYREPTIMSWNGYYKEHRIRIWYTGEYWVVAGYLTGIEACYFRNTDENCSLGKISQLVQCTCFYIDVISKTNEDA